MLNHFMPPLMLLEFIPVFEAAGFLPALKFHDPAHAIFKLSVLKQILNDLQYSMISEECFHSVS